MKCMCGNELGEVTVETKGACPECERSIWLQVARLEQPDSKRIAFELTRDRAQHCRCQPMFKTICYSRCGVVGVGMYFGALAWSPITPERRQQWFDSVLMTDEERKSR
jgi:hypothetical protein